MSLTERALAHASTHPESRDLIHELVDRIEAVERTRYRIDHSTWEQDMNPEAWEALFPNGLTIDPDTGD